MAESQSFTVPVASETANQEEDAPKSPLKLTLKKPTKDKRVQWASETIDNEHMNKKKSKCCCIYEKPKLFGESSSEDDDGECSGHCRGHRKKCFRNINEQPGDNGKDFEEHDNNSHYQSA